METTETVKETETIECKACGIVKPLDEMVKDARKALGYIRKCKQCKRELMRESRKQEAESLPKTSAEISKQWRERNPEKSRAYAREYVKAHPEQVRENKRKYSATKGAENARKYRKKDPEKSREACRRYRANKRASELIALGIAIGLQLAAKGGGVNG